MDGSLEGYMKPFFEEVQILKWKEDKEEDGFFRAAWEAVAGLFVEAVENQPRDQVATKIPISGNVNELGTYISTTVMNLLRHAFIRAFNKGLEGSAAVANNEKKISLLLPLTACYMGFHTKRPVMSRTFLYNSVCSQTLLIIKRPY